MEARRKQFLEDANLYPEFYKPGQRPPKQATSVISLSSSSSIASSEPPSLPPAGKSNIRTRPIVISSDEEDDAPTHGSSKPVSGMQQPFKSQVLATLEGWTRDYHDDQAQDLPVQLLVIDQLMIPSLFVKIMMNTVLKHENSLVLGVNGGDHEFVEDSSDSLDTVWRVNRSGTTSDSARTSGSSSLAMFDRLAIGPLHEEEQKHGANDIGVK
ncbi:hypothetical protein PAXINDRAFT_98775 [Paxillus involutus ATCC 200175]|nr:hypothetical protein PAXINDRAFT_98775 [Paxillus involutus ATCC 200175]